MSEAQASYDARGGLLNVVDIVVAPQAAFARLRAAPAWAWSYLAAALLTVAGLLLMMPVMLAVFERTGPALYAALPQFQKLPADQQAAAIARAMSFGRIAMQFTWVFVPAGLLVGGLVSTVVMLAANALGRGDGTFRRLWALAMAATVVTGLGVLLTGAIVALRGPDAFGAESDVQRALPSLALLAPGAPAKLSAFLGGFNVTTVWSAVLLALGMTTVARIRRPVALAAAAVLLVGTALFASVFTPA